jgi:uncharacterized damage-inducible protein DinB
VSKLSLLTLVFGASSFLPLQAQQNQTGDWIKHLTTAKELTLAVARAMPDESYGFKPNPEEMSFAEQLDHLSRAQAGACGRVTDITSPVAKPETLDKASLVKEITAAYGFCISSLANFNDSQLDKVVGSAGHQMSAREALLSSLVHAAHHRGQAEVYLRIKNIKPPQYGF